MNALAKAEHVPILADRGVPIYAIGLPFLVIRASEETFLVAVGSVSPTELHVVLSAGGWVPENLDGFSDLLACGYSSFSLCRIEGGAEDGDWCLPSGT